LEIKTVLKLLGAAATGGFLALKFKRPIKKYDEFVALYDLIGIDFIHQIENHLFQTLLPFLDNKNVEELDSLLDRQATYQEKLRFCQKNIPNFNEKTIKAITRFVQSEDLIDLVSTHRRHSISADDESLCLVVKELNQVLEQCFDEAMIVNIPEQDRREFRNFCDQKASLREKLTCFNERYDSFGSVLFDTLSFFESKLYESKSEG